MSQRNRKHRPRKHRRRQYLLFTGILFSAVVFAGSFLWLGFGDRADKDRVIEEAPFTITHNRVQAKEEKDNNTQDAGTEEAWNLMLINKDNPIPNNYDVNLVELEGGECVDARIYEPLMEMLHAAREANRGELPAVVSGYRTQKTQQRLYDEKIAKFKKEGYGESEAVNQAEQWVAVPGYSEHQLGFAVDINGAVYDVYLWLQENSYKYGFIFRYPGSKTHITGTAEEVWHYRYVGKEAAKEIYKRGICLEEYLRDL